MTDTDSSKDLAALEIVQRARMNFAAVVCERSAVKDDDTLDALRLESMFEFAEFYFVMGVMNFDAPEDIDILADLHNQRIERLIENAEAMRRRHLRKERLLTALFTEDTRPRLRELWRESPGALDQSNLARFLQPQMSAESPRKLVVVCERAGFLSRRDSVFGSVVVTSTGKMEEAFGACIREMRLAISAL